MKSSVRGSLILLLLLSLHAGAVIANAQTPDATASLMPPRIEICEFPKMGFLRYHHCGTLTWNGLSYDAIFLPLIGPGEAPVDTGAVGVVTMVRAGNNVTFSRVDSEGTEGTSTYQGTATGNGAAGTVIWYHPGLPNIKGTWTATFVASPPQIPSQSIGEKLEECEEPVPNPLGVKNCGTLTWNGQRYDAAWSGVSNGISPPGPPTTASVTLKRDSSRVTLNRVDVTGTPGVSAVYQGVFQDDTTLAGTVVWSFNGSVYGAGTWTAKLKLR